MKTAAFRAALPILVTVSLSACAHQEAGEEPVALPELALQQGKPVPALAEHLLQDYFGSDIVDPPTVCVALEGASEGTYEGLPSDDEVALIERFPQLAPFTRCTQDGAQWTDSDSGQPAMVFDIHSFGCADDASCTGWAGYTAGSAKGEYAEYTMTYTGGRWTFERDERRLLSE